MSETPETNDTPGKRSLVRRVGCWIAVVVWFLLLLTPCFCIALATQGEIIIPQGSAPGQQIRIWLIMETEQRGLGVSSASVKQTEPNALCVETNTRFLFWTGQSDPLVSCECYMQDSADQPWSTVSVANQACESDG
jgi:hypothetical protein